MTVERYDSLLEELIEALDAKDKNKLKELFDELHSYDKAQFLMDLTPKQREMFRHFSDEELAEILEELDYEDQKVLIEELGFQRTAGILEEMSSDDAVDLLGELEEEEKLEIFQLMDDKEEIDIKKLMQYPEDTAGGLMTNEFITIPDTFTTEDTLKRIRKIAPDAETAYYIYVVDEKKNLRGVLSLRELIISPPDTKVEEIMFERVVSVPAEMDQEEVASIMEKYDFLALPVVQENKVMGIITIDDVVDVLQDEASEDIYRLGGFSGSDQDFKEASTSIFKSAQRRIPWLVLLLFLGLLAGNIIDQFEDTLESVAILAVFIPMIADMAGNTGTQSLAVVVRGLTLGEYEEEGVFPVIRREAGAGIIIGIVNGLLISVIATFWQGNPMLGVVIGLSLLITLFVATLSGTIIPLIMNKLNIDPAVASGPFITTINDMIGLTIYFSIATYFMEHLV
ncbi:magnesium transporter [Isachenkonia alkalipeptolytica]|uniref:Magnesium transporter MgtE n=1 Tax=Isachenkonia alkalipeptolytica TaxID=2565777 RepID=A0AA43XJD9_9CLOT|nr:magnesium transporter [Isachenkonia alkalipeptolytica]NBG87409.1 magnesium transporter [Isachenkonia alkalipeptolytica]